jgi:hypothetical protein
MLEKYVGTWWEREKVFPVVSPVASPNGAETPVFPKRLPTGLTKKYPRAHIGETGGHIGEIRRDYRGRDLGTSPMVKINSPNRGGQGTRGVPIPSASNPGIFLLFLGVVPRGVPRGGSLWITPGIP